MERCELRGTDLAKARITNCDFTEANLDGANLSGCVFSASTDMSCASLRGANLSQVEFEPGSDLREDVDLTDAILDGASGSVRIGPGTKGIGELECNNHIPHARGICRLREAIRCREAGHGQDQGPLARP